MHFLIRLKRQTERDNYFDSYSNVKNILRSGDTVIFKGEEPLTRSEFYEIANDLTLKGVDIILETKGATFSNPDNLSRILSNYRIREVLIKLYSLSFPINDEFFSSKGISIKTLMGLENLLKRGFKDVSILTYIREDGFLNRIKSIYDYKREKKLKYLYIELDKDLPIEKRISILKAISERFSEADDIIVRNNDFEIILNDVRSNKTEIKSEPKSGTLNLVLKNFCTNNCTFCTTRIVQRAYNAPLPFDSKDKVIKLIQSHTRRLKKRNLFEIVAVEPLEHPDILEILSVVNNLSFQKIRLLTHGRPLKDVGIIKKLKQLNVKEIIIPITFYSPKSALANVGDEKAYYDLQDVLRNIKRVNGIDFIFNIIVSRHNFRDIVNIVDFLKKNGIKDFSFNLALPSIEDERFFTPYGITFTDLMDEIVRISDNKLRDKIILSLSYIIPPCVLYRYCDKSIIECIKREKIKDVEMSISSKRKFSQYKSTSKCKKSSICNFGQFCIGVNKIYIKAFGDNEFEAIKNE